MMRRPMSTEPDTVVLPALGDHETSGSGQSLSKSSGSMAIASLFSKITGFLRNLALAWVVGLAVTADAYNAANTLPNQVYELLIGGVLTSVLVPVLVRAYHDDDDNGDAYTQRLLTMAAAALIVVTVLAVLAAPMLTSLVVDNSTGHANPALATAFAYLLLPQILFYGLSALFTAVLNAKHVFGPTAWAPVLNNVVVLATLTAFYLLPGQMSLDPVRMGDAHLLVLGVGSTLGVFLQAVVLLPTLRKAGFRFRWRWGWDARFTAFGGLAAWTIGYTLLSQVGVVVVAQVATANTGLAIYNNVWLLVGLPYGVIGYSLITAILPRMSKAAADHKMQDVVQDLSLANRMCTVMMLPMSALMTVLGPSLATALFSVGKGGEDAARLGTALAFGAFGVLPYAITLIQLRVFYSMEDAKTPTLIMLIMTVVKVPLTYLTPALLPTEQVIYGVCFVNSLVFVVGWIVGEIWLRARLGKLDGKRFASTLGTTLLASAIGALAAIGIKALMTSAVHAPVASAWLSLVVGGVVGLAVALGVQIAFRTEELEPVLRRVSRLAGR